MAKNNGTQAAEMTTQARNALRVATITLGLAVAADILYFALAFRTGAWQLFAWGVDVFGSVVVLLASIWLIRRGRSVLAVWLMFGGLAVVVALAMLWIAGLGLVLGLGCVIALSQMAVHMLPPKQTGWGFIASVVVGAAVLLVDVFGPADRLTAPPEMMIFVLVIVALMALVLVFLLARQFVNYTLHMKLITTFLAVALISVGLLAFLNNRVTRVVLTDDANQALFAAASQTATNIDAFINTNLDVIRTEAQLPLWSKYLKLVADQKSDSTIEWEVRTTLRALSHKTNISSCALLDHQGRDVMDTFASDIGTDKSDREYFQEPLKSGLPYVSPVEFSPTTDKPSLYFSSPVRNSAGHIVGVLRMRYDATVLQALVVQSNGLAGPDSFAVLFDEYHIHLAHGTASEMILQAVAPLDPARLAELQAARRLPDLPADELSTNLPALEQNLTNAADQPYFTVKDAMSGRMNQVAVTTLKTQPWLVTFFQPQDAFLAPVKAQERSAVLLAVMIAVVVVAAALGVARLLAGPIIRLTAVATSVAAGDLTAQARVESGDEIGTLATTFNSMTEQLRELISGLEQRVAERTREYEEAVVRTQQAYAQLHETYQKLEVTTLQAQRRAMQLETAAEVSRAATSVLDPDELVRQAVDLIRDRFDLYYASLFLLDESGHRAVLRAGTGEPGRQMLKAGHKLEVGGQSMVGWCTANAQARIALDVGEEAVRFDNPLLPETRSEMALPLTSRGQVIGALDVQSVEEGAFSDEDITVLQTMADQIAVAIDNARLFAEAQARLEAVQAAHRSYLRQSWDEFLPTRKTTDYEYAQPGVILPKDAVWPKVRQVMAQQQRTVVMPGSGDGEEEPAPAQSALVTPITLRGQVIGALGLQEVDRTRQWTADEIALVEAVADQMALAVENARLFEEAQRRLQEITTLYEASQACLSISDQEILLTAIIEAAVRATGATLGSVMLADAKKGEYVFGATYGMSKETTAAIKNELHIPLEKGLVGAMVSAGHPLVVADVSTDPRWVPLETKEPMRSFLGVPLVSRDGRPLGAIILSHPEVGAFDEDHARLLSTFANQAALAIENARLFEATQAQARRERLIREITGKVQGSIDLDAILQTTVQELGKALGTSHAVVRLGTEAELKTPLVEGQADSDVGS